MLRGVEGAVTRNAGSLGAGPAFGTLAVSPLGDVHLRRKLAHQSRLGAADPLGNRGDTRRQVLPGYGRFGRRMARQRIARQGASDDCDQGRNRGSVPRRRFTIMRIGHPPR